MFKTGTSGHAGGWHGVIRNAKGAVVWTCPHCHTNRDQSTRSNYSARACADAHLAAATDETFGDWLFKQSINNPVADPATVRRIQQQKERAPEVRAALGI
jgi:hypothetical protein